MQAPPVTRRHDWLAVALLGLLASALFIDVLVGSSNFYMRDLTRYYYPTKQILREIVQNGEFPYWNRYFHAGQPIAANPEHEVFYPFTWLILLPSYDLGYRLHILVHIYIGLFGMYALLRSMELRPPAAVFGALAFGLGGIYLSYINLLPILFCAAWLPLTCLYVRRFLLKPALRDFALAAFFLGLQFLVAEPTTVMQTGFLIGMYALYRGWYAAKESDYRFWRRAPAEMLSRVAFIALISIAAVAMGAAQMLPALDHVGDSARSRVFDFKLVSAWSMPYAKLAELIYPNVLGHISINRIMWYWGGGLYPGMGSPFLFSIYPGLLATSLAVAGFFVRPRGTRFVMLLSAFSLLLAMGGNTPLLELLYKAGVATSIRYPEKFLLIGVFAITIYAAQMLDRLLAGDSEIRDAALGFVLATTIVAAVLAVIAFFPIYSTNFQKIWGLQKGGAALRMVEMSRDGWIIAAVRGALLFALLWFSLRLKRPLFLALALIFVAADIAPVVHQLNPRMPSRFFLEKPPVAKTLPSDRSSFRLFHEADWYGQEEMAKKYFSTGQAVYWIVRNGLYPMTPAGNRILTVFERDYDKTALLPAIDVTDSVWDVKRSGRKDWWTPFMTMGAARYRAVYRDFETEKKRVGGDLMKAQPLELIDYGYKPRYYFADRLVPVINRHDFAKKLGKNTHSVRTAYVTEPAPQFTPAPGKVQGLRETANSAVIDVESAGRAFLIMSVTPHKYWTITIDGRKVQPFVTNIGFQGLEVPAGKHRISMRYRNTLCDIGAVVSAITAFALIAAALTARRSRTA